MNQRILRLLLFVLMALSSAMSVQADNVGKKINAVKLGGKCFYAESTDPSESVAKSDATTFLANYINEYLKDNGILMDKVTESTIPGVKYFTMDRSGNKRVFAFVEKAVILDGATPAPQPVDEDAEPAPAPAPEPAPEPQLAAVPAPEPEPAPVPESEPVAAVEPEPAPAPAVTTPVAEVSSADSDNSSYDFVDFLADLFLYASYDAISTSAEQQKQKSSNEVLVNSLSELAKAENIKEAFVKLQRLNAEYVVKRYGPMSKCKNAMWSYWLIYGSDGKTLIGYLSPGKDGERMEMLSGAENASLDTYLGKGNTALFFELRY